LRIARFGVGEMHRWGDEAGTWLGIFEWRCLVKGKSRDTPFLAHFA
jgi:hypothetical protein